MEGNQDDERGIKKTTKLVDPATHYPEEGSESNLFKHFSPWVSEHEDLIKADEIATAIGNNRVAEKATQSLHESLATEVVQSYFKSETTKRGFNNLLTNEAKRNGTIDALVDEFDLQNVDDESAKYSSDYDFAGVFINADTPLATRVRFSELHTTALQEAGMKLFRLELELKRSFRRDLEHAIERGIIPKSLDITNTNAFRAALIASDPVVDLAWDRSGFYRASENIIGISAECLNDPELTKEIYYHEMLHALSGKIIHETSTADNIEGFEIETVSYDANRVGLQSPGSYEINEAYTEWAAMMLLGKGYQHEDLLQDAVYERIPWNDLTKRYGQTYLIERILLAGIAESGVSIDSIGEAYFESYIPKSVDDSLGRGERAPARWALDRKINNLLMEPSLNKLLNSLRGNKRSRGHNSMDESIEMIRVLFEKKSEARNIRNEKAKETLFRMLGPRKKSK